MLFFRINKFTLTNEAFILNISSIFQRPTLKRTMAEAMSYFKAFDTDVSAVDAGTKWNEYVKAYIRFTSFGGIKDDQRKIDGLLHFAGRKHRRHLSNGRVE